MNINFKYNRGLQVKVNLTEDEYAEAVRAVPIPNSEVQGLEHSGDDLLHRLARMIDALKAKMKDCRS